MIHASAAIGVLATAILLAVIAEDLRHFRIRNVSVLALLGCFVVDVTYGTRVGELLPHLLFGGGCFLTLLVMFDRGWIGGGDAKLLSVALVWVGPTYAVPFSLLLMIATLGYVLGAYLGWLPTRTTEGRYMIPFGPSVAVAWIILVLLQHLNIDQGQNN